MCDDPKMLVNAMKSYLGLEDVNTMDFALEKSELVGSTKQNSTCHRVLIATFINLIKFIISFLILTPMQFINTWRIVEF